MMQVFLSEMKNQKCLKLEAAEESSEVPWLCTIKA